MVIRSFHLGDYKAVSVIFENTLSTSLIEETLFSFSRRFFWDSDLVMVALLNNKIVGVIVGTVQQNIGICYRIAVEGNYQNIGIGKSLMLSLVKCFHARKVFHIGIALDDVNNKINKFYDMLGFCENDYIRL